SLDPARYTGCAAMQTDAYGILVDDEGIVDVQVRLISELNTALDQVLAQQRTTRALVAISAAGPLGVALALVMLAAQLVVHRRRVALDLLRARGLTEQQLRRALALEGAALGLPAAALGTAVGVALTSGPLHWSVWPIALLVAALPTGALAVAARGLSAGRTRTDLSTRAGRWRLVAEVLVLAGAAAALWQLLRRDDAATAAGLDLLAAATPILLALAACLLVLRV
ncbi:MAG: hypothetical protein Q4G35_14200, partial [Propionibacteriaceae bacterium]|nr:hypothetical protein [Propionibacteriaceae bacterium]